MERTKRLEQYKQKRQEIVQFYEANDQNLGETARRFGLTIQRIHSIVKKEAA